MISLTNLTRNLILRQQPSVMVESMTSSFHTSSILERARRGTREKKRKVSVQNKKKKEALLLKNPPPIPYKVELMLKSKGLFGAPKPLREKDADLPIATDDVYFAKDFAYKRYPLNEALDILRLIHDPSMLNEPNGIIRIKVELDMRATKKDRYLEGFTKMVPILKHYERNVPDRNVMAFVATEEKRLDAIQAGASMAGGQELITDVAKGRIDISEIDHFLCHDELAGNIKPLAGVLRDKTPTIAAGTIGKDIPGMINIFGKGMHLGINKVKPSLGVADEPDYGFCETSIGRLEMNVEDIHENLTAILEVINENKPKRKDNSGFITRVMAYILPSGATSVPSTSKFTIIHPLVHDLRVKEQEQVVTEGRAAIARTLTELKSS